MKASRSTVRIFKFDGDVIGGSVVMIAPAAAVRLGLALDLAGDEKLATPERMPGPPVVPGPKPGW